MIPLTPRQRELLRAVVDAYIATGRPVSSRVVAEGQRGRKLSPATIRAELAALTRSGLLTQPHPSAGRVPSHTGLRAYIDASLRPQLHPWDRAHLDAAASDTTVAALPSHIGQCLADITGEMAVVGVPRFVGSTFREVGLVPCGKGRILAYFVSPGGQVQQTLVDVDFDLSPIELQRAQNYLNSHLTNRTLLEVRDTIREELEVERDRRDRLRQVALEIGLKALPRPELELVVEGAAQLATKPEFTDVDKLHGLLSAIDTKSALLELLERILGGTDVTVVLGSEHQVPEVADLACVGSSCATSGGRPSATISLMGPPRMDYGRLVPLVRYAVQLFERHWKPF